MKKGRPRLDGFAGQHLLVLPEPLCVRARAHPLLRGLHVTDAGYFPAADNHLVERPNGAATTLVMLCLRGAGWVKCGQEKWAVIAGNLVWLPAGEAHAYGAATDDPWTIVWVHFAGNETDAWRELLGGAGRGQPCVLTLPEDRFDEVGLDQVYAALEGGFGLWHQVAAAAALRHGLSRAVQLRHAPRDARSAHERVMVSIEALRRDWQRPHTLPELAAAANVSVAHYSALFRRHTGFAPIDFIIRLRVQHACRLLDTTKLPIGEIAERVGYTDPYYFTRRFRRIMGRAPRLYRQVPKG